MLERIKQNKEWLVASLIGASLAAGGMTVSNYVLQNPKEAELTEIEAVVNKLIDYQEQYVETHGHYWQGLATDTRIPKDGEYLTPIKLDSKPIYEQESWTDLAIISSTLPWIIEVNNYEDWQGNKGWQVFFRKQEGNFILERAIGFGVQKAERTYNWRIIKDTIPSTGTASTTP